MLKCCSQKCEGVSTGFFSASPPGRVHVSYPWEVIIVIEKHAEIWVSLQKETWDDTNKNIQVVNDL